MDPRSRSSAYCYSSDSSLAAQRTEDPSYYQSNTCEPSRYLANKKKGSQKNLQPIFLRLFATQNGIRGSILRFLTHTMKLKLLSILLGGSISLVSFSGCESGPRTQDGTALGAFGGAILGAVVGHQSGHGAEGAAIGAVTGGLIGNSVGKEQDRNRAQEQYYQTELEIAKARQARAEAQANEQRQITTGRQTEDAEVLAAKQRAEAAEAELARVRKERADAIARAKAIEDYKKREQEAAAKINELQGN